VIRQKAVGEAVGCADRSGERKTGPLDRIED
jgi:hypothetical protein